MHNEALSAQREPWISHTDVNLKMRKSASRCPSVQTASSTAPVEEEEEEKPEELLFLAENYSALKCILVCKIQHNSHHSRISPKV